jgi:hypothetical protein
VHAWTWSNQWLANLKMPCGMLLVAVDVVNLLETVIAGGHAVLCVDKERTIMHNIDAAQSISLYWHGQEFVANRF